MRHIPASGLARVAWVCGDRHPTRKRRLAGHDAG